MNDKTNCNPMNCDDPRACGKKDCQREMIETLKDNIKENLDITEEEVKKKVIDIIKLNIKQDIEDEIKRAKTEIGGSYSFSRFLFDSLRYIISLVAGVTWLAGFVIAKGFWSTFFCIIPFYAWYLIVEAYLVKYGL